MELEAECNHVEALNWKSCRSFSVDLIVILYVPSNRNEYQGS
jgi:hypothetical protein